MSDAQDGGGKILIVDDVPTNIDLLINILEPKGYRIVFAATGEKAVKIAPRTLPDLILMDVMMPGIDGFEACRQIKEIEATRDIPVIFVTAKRDQESISKGFLVGGVDYIAKPVHTEEVRSRVATHIALHEHKTQLDHLVKARTLDLAEKTRALQAVNENLQESNEFLEAEIINRQQAEHRLCETQREMTALAHRAGMSVIATGVLHNIGNILNSVNSVGEVIHSGLKESPLAGLAKANQLLSQHADDLGEFLSKDKGKKLQLYYQKLEKVLSKNQENLLQHAEKIREHITMMSDVIRAQQDYAVSGTMNEPLQAAKLVEDSLRLFQGTTFRYHIEIERRYQAVVDIMVQKVKLVQVLVNLFKNAKEAIAEQPGKDNRLLIEIAAAKPDWVMIRITDNGIGISQAHRDKIFSHGYTTKDSGHGFGLHYCANAMKEMGCQLMMDSEGKGKGAVFTLLCPASPSAKGTAPTPLGTVTK